MAFIENNDLLTLALISSIILCMIIPLLFWSLKHYEIVITLMLLSPWVSWIFYKNIPTEVEDIEAGYSSYIRVSIVLILGMIGYLKFFKLRALNPEKFPFHFKLFAFYLLLALLSTTYSIDKFYTFIRAFEYTAFFGFLLGFFYWLKDKSHLDKALNIYSGVIILGIIINIISLVAFPDLVWRWKTPGRFSGLMGHPNAVGSFCMLAYPALMWKYNKTFSKGKLLIVLLSCSALLMHLISGSRSSFAAAIFGLIGWNLFLKNKVKLLTIFALLIILVLSFFISPFKMRSLERGKGSLTDLTGREDLWKGSIQLIFEKPILGYGFGVGGKIWTDPRYHKEYAKLWVGSARSSLHNGYLGSAIGGGIVGLLILLASLIIPVWRTIFTQVSIYKSLVLVVIFQILLLNFTESVLTGGRTFTPLVLWFFWVIAARSPDIFHSKNN